MCKHLVNLLFLIYFTAPSIAQNGGFKLTSKDKKHIEYHISDFNAYKDKPVPVNEIISKINFLKSLDSSELTRSEHWFIKVFELYQIDPVNKKIRPQRNFEDLKAELNNYPFQGTNLSFDDRADDVLVYEVSGGFENAVTIDFIRPHTKNCRSIPNADKRDKCTYKRIQFAIKQHFQTNKAIEIFRKNNGEIYMRDHEVTIYTSLKIDKKGKIRISNISSYDDELSKLAQRAIKRFPRFEPAKLNGEPIEVKFNLPIVFTVYANEDE